MMIGSISFGIFGSPFMAAVHTLQEGAMALRIVFGICLVIVLLAGTHVFRERKKLFGRDPEVTDDGWAARNLRFWEVLLIWILAMDLLITMLGRLR